MAETVESTTTTVKNLEGGGTYFERIKTINTYWHNMPPNFRRVFIGYSAITVGCYSVYNYNDGKNALIDFRIKNGIPTLPKNGSLSNKVSGPITISGTPSSSHGPLPARLCRLSFWLSIPLLNHLARFNTDLDNAEAGTILPYA